MRIFILNIAAAGLVLSSTAHARLYKNYINPTQAEEVFSAIQFGKPISQQRWRELLGSRLTQRYTVQEGDNLWNISTRTVGDPFLWRKLWQVNPELSNPHDLPVGQILSYYKEGGDPAAIHIPLVKLVPNKPGAATDLDSDSLVNIETKNQYRPSFYVISEEEVVGEVTGAYSAKEWLGDLDEIYVRLDAGETVPVKTRFSVVRFERQIEDQTAAGKPFLGMLVRLVGEIEVVHQGEKLSRANLVRHKEIVQRGDRIIPLRAPLKPSAVFNPPEDMSTRVVMGETADAKYYGQGQIVLLNKGEADGVKTGFLFRILQDMDPQTESTKDVSAGFKGEVQVIDVGQLSSIGLILRNSSPVLVGDTLLAAQLFPEPPPTPRRPISEIFLD